MVSRTMTICISVVVSRYSKTHWSGMFQEPPETVLHSLYQDKKLEILLKSCLQSQSKVLKDKNQESTFFFSPGYKSAYHSTNGYWNSGSQCCKDKPPCNCRRRLATVWSRSRNLCQDHGRYRVLQCTRSLIPLSKSWWLQIKPAESKVRSL